MAGASALSLATLAGVVAAAAPVADADMRAATDRLLADVGAVRHLAARGTLERRVETRAEARARRGAELAAAAADPELAARARLWEGLGLAPPGTDARAVAVALDAAPTASYDALTRRLSVPDWIPLADQRPALAHALAHAVADARFGVRDFLGIDQEGRHHLDGDAERARLALVEGDAEVTTLELDDPLGALTGTHARTAFTAALGTAPAPRGEPDWLRANAAFTHADGLAFVARVRARAPWSAVDALWAEPPRSSEQILHPEKYEAREAPLVVAPLRARALGAFHEVAGDVLGELGVRAWLAALPGEIAARAAAGWGGDRAALFEGAGARTAPDAGAPPASPASFVVWSTAWDDVTDAEDFARAAVRVLASRAGASDVSADDPHRFVARGALGVSALAWRGSVVAVLVGAPESTLAALDELVAKAPVTPRASVRRRGAR